MKILELTNFSAGGCGVFARVLQESLLLSKKGHEVMIFSSYFEKGTWKVMPLEDKYQKVRVRRFKAKKLGGESFLKWDFEDEAIKFNPDVIIAHGYRHVHTTKALKIKSKIDCKVFLVTHAPFVERNSTRSLPAKFSVRVYDSTIGKKTINNFDKVLHITNWELPFLFSLGVKKEKLIYSPNGIGQEFFRTKKSHAESRKVLFIGRISPIKNLEVLIKSMHLITNNSVKLEIVGPAEEQYLSSLKSLVEKLNLAKRVNFLAPIYDIREKIKKIDSAKIFVLPSKREAMPQALIEAMARGKICIASDNPGSREIISHKKNGFIFQNEVAGDLAKNIDYVLSQKNTNNVSINAKKSVEKFSWDKIIKGLEKAITHDRRSNNFI